VSGYAAHRFPVGTSRLELTASRLERDAESGHGYGFIWDEEWNVANDLSLSTTLSHTTESGLSNDADISTVALLLRHDLDSRFYWNGDISYSVTNTDVNDNRENAFTSQAEFWNFLPDWNASLRATHDMVDNAQRSNNPLLVLHQHDNYGFSWSVIAQGKAQLAGNGPRP